MRRRLALRLVRELDLSVLLYHLAQEWRTRPRREEGDRWRPTAMYVESASACGGQCLDCYVPAKDRRADLRLGDAVLDRLVAHARRLRLSYVCLVGGEPLDPAIVETHLRLARDHPQVRFLLCTGGQAECDADLVEALAGLRNLSPIFSFDGFEGTHDRLRGIGSHARVSELLARFRRAESGPRGASVTLRPESWREVTGVDFARALADLGCHYLVFDPCLARGERGLSTTDYVSAVRRLRRVAREVPVRVFANPFGEVGGGRSPAWTMRALTIDYHGNVYASRRGRPHGNVHEEDLAAILEHVTPARVEGDGAAGPDDPRHVLFEATLAALA